MTSRLFWTFLKIGTFAFGGPVAGMALIEHELFRDPKNPFPITRERFREIFAMVKLLPGPVVSQLVIAVGREIAGSKGGWTAGVAFMIPATLIITALSYAYGSIEWVKTPDAQKLFQGLQMGALALILQASVMLSKGAVTREARTWVPLAAAAVAVWLYPPIEPLLIVGFGLISVWIARKPGRKESKTLEASLFFPLAWVCLKGSLLTFGTGLAIVPILKHDLVDIGHFITQAQFIDGLMFAQIKPGPIFSAVTFYGHQMAGLPGALVATLCAFLPGFAIVLWILPKIIGRLSASAPAFLMGAVPAVVGALYGTWLNLSLPYLRSNIMLFTGLNAVVLIGRVPPLAIILLGGAIRYFLPASF